MYMQLASSGTQQHMVWFFLLLLLLLRVVCEASDDLTAVGSYLQLTY